MAKEGLDYFPLNCQVDEKIELIEADFGLKGFAIVVKLFQRIYGEHGYYCEWNDDIALLFARQNGLLNGGVNNLIQEVVSASIRRGVFDNDLYERYGILTSKGIQKRYLDAVSRRSQINLNKNYLLLNDGNFKGNVNIFEENVCRNEKNVCSFKQSKGKESKGKKINNMCKADALALFESLWKLYPNKKGKGQISEKTKMRIAEIGFEEMSRAIERYKKELEKDKDWRKPQNGSTFFNSGYVDYLDANYEESKSSPTKKNQFNSFGQHDYDFDSLEKELLGN